MLDVRSPARNPVPVFLSPEAELRRLDAHFRRVLRKLHREPPPGLGRAQRRARGRHLDELERYRRARTFPKNRSFPGLMVPIFIDDAGTRCAMGHLIERGGGADLVHHVARTRNFARVHALAGIPELVDWLERNGLTLDEAALVQPSYCEAASQCVCLGESPSVLVEGDVQAEPPGTLLVTSVYGESADVAVGDVVPLSSSAAVGTHLLGILSDDGIVSGAWAVDASGEVSIEGCGFATIIPGPLPVAVLAEAKLAGSDAACEQVLANHDKAWTTKNGDCGPGGTGGEGGAGGMMTGGGGTGGTMTTTSTPTDPTSCWDALQQGMTDSGVVTIDPNGDGTKIEVYCDQVNDEGGWALLYNSLGVENGTTPAFWNIPYEARLATKIEPPGPPGLDKNYYAGSLYIHGKEYRDDIVDLGGSEVRNVMRATADGIETATMKFISPKVVTGINLNSAIYNDQFAKGWSAPGDPDFDGDEAGYNCAVFWGNITQHYASCWKYNLGADGNVADKSDDNWGPHVFNSVIDQINLASPNGASLAKQPNDNDASRVNRISRFVRWGKNP